MKQTVKNDRRYVEYVVTMWLRDKPELQEFQQDLIQEGMLGLIRGREKYREGSTVDKALWLNYQIRFALQKYIDRREVKHFRSLRPEDRSEEGSPRWDLPEAYDVEQLKCPQKPVDCDKLSHYTERIHMTPREEEILELYLKHDDYAEVARHVGISRERVRQIINSIITKCQQLG